MKKTNIVLVIALCIVLFSTSAFAKAPNVKYVDADTVCRLYSELYAKYYPDGEVTVSVDKANFQPMLESALQQKLIDLEERLKTATLPENNVWVKCDENNNIELAYKQGYEKNAKEYIELEKTQEFNTINKDMEYVTPLAVDETKNVGRAFFWNISSSLPWSGSSYVVGYQCTFQIANHLDYVYYFTRKPWGFSARQGYSGLGDCETTLTGYSSTLINSDTTCSNTVYLDIHAWVTDADGILHTYRSSLILRNSKYAQDLW